MKKALLIGGVALVVTVLVLYAFIRSATAPTRPAEIQDASVLTNLYVPWEAALLPDGRWLVTQRDGKLRIGDAEVQVQDAIERGEGGLLGLALDPAFGSNDFVYLYFTTAVDGARENRIVRYTLDGSALTAPRVVISGIPAAENHNGGRIAFGPDGYLYVATGDAGEERLAQDRNSLAGKILRIARDGSAPQDNPFGNEVYSYGHRNVQGLAWDARGQLWATEHGRSGVLSGFDELNRIVPGGNYGWPEIEGDEAREGMIAPAAHSGARTTWAPSALLFKDGALYFGGLRGRALYRATISGDRVVDVEPLLEGVYGRIRVVTEAAGKIWIGTSNRDGRGTPSAGDDILTPVDL